MKNTYNNLVESNHDHLKQQIQNLVSFYSLLTELTQKLDPKLSKIAYDAATILTRHFSILPNVENNENRKRYANYEPSHFVHNSGNHKNLKGFVPQSYCQLEYNAFLSESAVKKAIKFLIDKNICTGVVKCTTKGYYFNLDSLDIDLSNLITISRRYWGNEELLNAANSFIYQMRKKIVDKDGKELSTSYLEGRRALTFFAYLSTKKVFPKNSVIRKELRFDRDFLIGLIDSLQKGNYLTLGEFFSVNWKEVFSCKFPEERQLDFKEKNLALKYRNRMTKMVDWRFVNEISTTRHIFDKSMLPTERSLVIYIISTIAKREDIKIWWDFKAINVIMKTLSSVSYEDNQKEELLKRCSYKTIEDLFNHFHYEKDSNVPWYARFLHWYSTDSIRKEGVKDFNEFKGPYLSEYTFVKNEKEHKSVAGDYKMIKKDRWEKYRKMAEVAAAETDEQRKEHLLGELHLELCDNPDDWKDLSYIELREIGFCEEYAYFISVNRDNAKKYLNYEIDWSSVNPNLFIRHLTNGYSIYNYFGKYDGFYHQLEAFNKINRDKFEEVYYNWQYYSAEPVTLHNFYAIYAEIYETL